MGFASHFIHTCTITNQTGGSQSATGAPLMTPTGTQLLVKCRFVKPKGRTQFEPLPELGQMVQTDPYLFLSSDIDVDTQSLISTIVQASDKTLIDSDTYEVIESAKRSRRTYHHQRLRLKKVE